jgi:hypothetical protein
MIIGLLGLLGVGGIAGLALHLFGWAGTLSKLASFGRGAKDVASRIPPKVKLAIAGVLLLVVLFFVHQHYRPQGAQGGRRSGLRARRRCLSARARDRPCPAIERRKRFERGSAQSPLM